ncbi:MAG: VWA domain-containing protein [Armatimonadetes bacterium]|nr:VWA domain-containing protein [Anaerolineae bacterium]
MTLTYPAYLLGLLLLPLLIALYLWDARARAQALQRIGIGAARLADSTPPGQRYGRLALGLMAIVAVILALARPVWGLEPEIVEAQGIALIVALDVSTSMDAEDLTPSRLARAKLILRELLRGSEQGLFGLVLFAGDALVQFPLTGDLDTALTFIDAASTRSISRQGTAIADALTLALDLVDERITSQTVILLITDGENQTGDPLAVAELAAELGVTIHVIGVGTPEGGLIPVYDANGALLRYKTDRASNLIISKLDEPSLQAIAAATGGLYQRAAASGVETVNLQNRIAQVEGDLQTQRFQTRPVERFGVLVALALLALTGEWLLRPKGKVQI